MADEIDGWRVVAGANAVEPPAVHVSGAELSGNLGCSDFSAGFTVSLERMVPGELTYSDSGCLNESQTDDLMQAERVLIDVLAAGDGFKVWPEDNSMMIWVTRGHEIIFVRR